ncbi:hypothetical protein D3C84_774530 [compost metagenome]
MSSKALSRELTANSRNRKVKARATLPRKFRVVLCSSGIRFKPNWITSEGTTCARRWNTLLSRKSLSQYIDGCRPSNLTVCRMR